MSNKDQGSFQMFRLPWGKVLNDVCWGCAATPNSGAGHASPVDTQILELMKAVAGGSMNPEEAAKKMMASNGAGVREVQISFLGSTAVLASQDVFFVLLPL